MFNRKIKTNYAITTQQRMVDQKNPVTVFYSGANRFNVYIEKAKKYDSTKAAIKRATQLQKELGGVYLIQPIV